MNPIQVNDAVRLRADETMSGPRMMIGALHDDRALCQWLDAGGTWQKAWFDIDALYVPQSNMMSVNDGGLTTYTFEELPYGANTDGGWQVTWKYKTGEPMPKTWMPPPPPELLGQVGDNAFVMRDGSIVFGPPTPAPPGPDFAADHGHLPGQS